MSPVLFQQWKTVYQQRQQQRQHDQKQRRLNQCLIQAVRKHDIEESYYWLQEGADARLQERNGDPLICYAAGHCPPAIVYMMLDRGADLHARDHQGNTPLLCATRHNNQISKLLLLLTRSAEVNASNQRGETALMIAARDPEGYSGVDYLEMLLVHGADLHAVDHSGRTALEHAREETQRRLNDPNSRALYGWDDAPYRTTEQILQINAQDLLNWKLVHAVKQRELEKVRKYLDEGADVNATDRHRNSALSYTYSTQTLLRSALKRKRKTVRLQIAELLLERGADINLAARFIDRYNEYCYIERDCTWW